MLTSQNGIVVNRRDFFPFGEDIAVGVGGRSAGMGYGTDSLRHKFSGKERDQETGLDFFGARYYGNSLGRFLTTDPFSGSGRAENPQTWNRYTYVLNCPTGLIDPDGKQERGRGGNTVIDIFITATSTGTAIGVSRQGWEAIQKVGGARGTTVNVFEEAQSTRNEVRSSLTEHSITIFIGHGSRRITTEQDKKQIYTAVTLADGWIGQGGIIEGRRQQNGTLVATGVSEEIPDGTGIVGLFTCNSADATASAFGDRMVIANTGGPDGRTGGTALEHAAFNYLLVYIVTGGDRERAFRAAQEAISNRRKNFSTQRGVLNNVGDLLVVKGRYSLIDTQSTAPLEPQIQPKPTI